MIQTDHVSESSFQLVTGTSLRSGQGKMEGEASVGSFQGEACVLLCPCLLPADEHVDLMAGDLGNAAHTG